MSNSRLTTRRGQVLPSLSIPTSDFQSNIAETPEYEIGNLNLGAETPETLEDDHYLTIDSWARSGFPAHTSAPTRCGRTWRSSSSSLRNSRELRKEVVDRDCGICFELSVVPCRTSCCGTIFCFEHISDWLHGSFSDGRCPSCQAPCTLQSTTLLLSSGCPSPTTRPQTHVTSLPTTHSANSLTLPKSESRTPGYRETCKTPPSPLRPSSLSSTSSSPPSTSSSPSSPSLSIAGSTPPSSTEPSSGDEDKSPQSDRPHASAFPLDLQQHFRGYGLRSDSDSNQHSSMLAQDAEMSPWEIDVSKNSGETLSRVTSVVGLTLFLYVLLNS
ncbi:hypothetical protein L208DRAFT_1435633 [Tricholoma matsutake]|nr:hypothetical protein L208DRAFT_1435633 [Tricholoma matsutake 945]